MKQLLTYIAATLALLVFAATQTATAQGGGHGGFSPEKFQADLEEYITKEAGLTPREAAAVFPIYRELGQKQRERMDQIRRLSMIKGDNEAECAKSIRACDKLDIEIKQLDQTYHAKMIKVTSAQKVFRMLRAEMMFHRRALRKFNDKKGRGGKK